MRESGLNFEHHAKRIFHAASAYYMVNETGETLEGGKPSSVETAKIKDELFAALLDFRADFYGWPDTFLQKKIIKPLPSILDVPCKCPKCGWSGTVYDCEPNTDGDGSLECPECETVIEVKVSGKD